MMSSRGCACFSRSGARAAWALGVVVSACAGVAEARPVPGGPVSLLDPTDLPLRPDPAVVAGVLDNGVRYAVRSHAGSPGRVALRLDIKAGSLDEQEDERGAAFATALTLASALAETPAGEAVMMLGESLPPPMKAFDVQVGHHAAWFTVMLPLADEKAISIGMRCLLELASGAAGEALTDHAVLAARPRMLAERSGRLSKKDRLLSSLLEQVAPESRLRRHPPIPDEASLCALDAADLRRFAARCCTPARIQVVAAGDLPAERLAAAVRAVMGKVRGGGKAEPIFLPVEKPGLSARAAVVSDSAFIGAAVEALALHRAAGPIRTPRDWRSALAERAAAAALGQRLSSARERGVVKSAAAEIGPAPGPLHLSVASVSGDERDWRALVGELSAALKSVRRDGVSAAEAETARRTVLAAYADEAGRDASAPLPIVLDRIASALRSGGVCLSARDEAALAEQFLPGIDAGEMSRILAERFDESRVAIALMLPAGRDAPSAEEVLAAAESAEPAPTVRWAAAHNAGADGLAGARPEAGGVASIAVDPLVGLTTVRLENGATLHFRRMTAPGGRVALAVELTFAAEDAGAAVPAMEIAWVRPAARPMTSEQIDRLAEARGIETRIVAGRNGARIEAWCPRESLEQAFRIVHALLSEPVVEPAALERWRWVMNQRLAAREVDPAAAADEALRGTVGPWTPGGGRTPSRAEIDALTVEVVQSRLVGVVARAGIESAVAGDADRRETLDLAARYLGSLPVRPAVRRAPTRRPEARPVLCEHRLRLKPGALQAVVLVAVHGAGEGSGESAEALDLAARILAARLNTQRADSPPFARAVAVRLLATDNAEASGLLTAIGAAEPDSAEALAAYIERAFASLASVGPTEQEMVRARAEAIDEFDAQASDPAWWARRLASMGARGSRPTDILLSRDRLASMTGETIRRTLAEHDPAVCCGGDRLVIIASPAGTSEDERDRR